MERQELYCHDCGKYVRFNVPETDGNLIVNCPNCSHQHYRVVKNGIITEERWGSANRPTIYASNVITYNISATISTSSITCAFVSSSWLNTTACA